MSLSEQLQRVDGGQNNTLKAILNALGVTVGSQKIDQLAALAATISPKLKPDNLLSASVASLLGLGSNAVPNDAFKALATSFKESVITASWSGNQSTNVSISLSKAAKFAIVGVKFVDLEGGAMFCASVIPDGFSPIIPFSSSTFQASCYARINFAANGTAIYIMPQTGVKVFYAKVVAFV